MRDWIIHKWYFRYLDRIFKTFEKMVNQVYKAEKQNNSDINKDELRLQMWDDLYNIARRRWNWNMILDKSIQ